MTKKSEPSAHSSGSPAWQSETGKSFSMASHQAHASLFSECCSPRTELVPFETGKVSVGRQSWLPIRRQSLTDEGLKLQQALLSKPVGTWKPHSGNSKSAILYALSIVIVLATLLLYHSDL